MSRQRFAFMTDWFDAILRKGRRRYFGEALAESAAREALARPAQERIAAACSVLMGRIGDASRIAVAEQALRAYTELDKVGKLAFFALLRDDYGADAEAISRAYHAWQEQPGPNTAAKLFLVVEPRRQTLLRRLNLAPGATLQLVRMREDLLTLIREDPSLEAVDQDFFHLFGSWFNRGFLTMRRIDWNISASILEKIMGYERVHSMQGWDDLRRRVDPNDRRLYAFFHPATNDEPLIFVEVALTVGIPEAISSILSMPVSNTHVEADAAVFYSINNSLPGLKGISFGNFLIKQVVSNLSAEFPELRTFVTLSPAPGFAKWLDRQKDARSQSLVAALRGDWQSDAATIAALRPEVEAAAARYFVTERTSEGLPPDPVARFHLGNGASAWRINWPADLSPLALQSAYGLMINYLYEPTAIEAQHEAFVRDGVVAHSQALADILAAG